MATLLAPALGLASSIQSVDQAAPLVSVIIPTYNSAHFLPGVIQSVLDQQFEQYEIIVVDDGSQDNAAAVVAQYGDQIRYVYQENRGLAGARNTGIRMAKGELIALLDADDEWLPTYLSTICTLAAQHPEAAVYYCYARCMDADGHDLAQVLGAPVRPSEALYDALLRANYLIPSTITLRRSVAFAAGLFDEQLRSCEDWDLWLRILPAHQFVGTPVCLVRYRLHGNSLSTKLTSMHAAAQGTVEKNFGPEAGQPQSWSREKRRAYGGLYRYFCLTSVLRANDWTASATHLRRALQIDPTLATDLDLFYDLAMGSQPVGYRGAAHQLALAQNAEHIRKLLETVFTAAPSAELRSAARPTYGTAYYALGLLAYNTGQLSFSRRFLAKALYFRPVLWHHARVTGNLAKSLLGRSLLERIKKLW